ncbi:MFS general substrate transporter [Boletus coccyginus]|nr:MFS general substrate transporter [Boletus coccyginus]
MATSNTVPVQAKEEPVLPNFKTSSNSFITQASEDGEMAPSNSTALPTIANALHASQFTWVGTAYSLSAAVFHPMSDGLAQIYGRKPVLESSDNHRTLCTRQCMNMLIAGRTIQGLGGMAYTGCETARFMRLSRLNSTFVPSTGCVAAGIGPVTGGSLAAQGQWHLNLPISLVVCVLAIFLLDLPTPPGSSKEKLLRMDWIGNFLLIPSIVSFTIGLTWGGITAPCSATVLVLLTLASLAPPSLMTNVTTISGCIQAFYGNINIMGVISSPIMSAIYSLAVTSLAPSALITGLSIEVTERYRPQMWVGWAIVIVGFGLVCTTLAMDSLRKPFGFVVILGLDAGCVWGIVIGGTVLQNRLAKELPASLIQSHRELPARLKVQAEFPESLAVLWQVLADISGIGLVASLFVRGLPLHDVLDAN